MPVVKDYDPVTSGSLADDFSGADYDLVILGHPLGDQSGLEWLGRFMRIRSFPPVIVLGDRNERAVPWRPFVRGRRTTFPVKA